MKNIPQKLLEHALKKILGEEKKSLLKDSHWDFLRCVRKNDKQGIAKHYTTVEKTALNQGGGLQGGYLSPLGYSTELLNALDENSFLEPRATVVPMTTLETLCPFVDATLTPVAGTSPFFGGILFQWGQSQSGSPGTAIAETEPAFNQLSLKANTLIGILICSNQFVQDIGDEGELALIRLFGRAIAWYKEWAFFNGKGADAFQPLGILNCPGKLTPQRSVPGNIGQDDIFTMVGKMYPMGWSHSIWACSPTAFAKIGTMSNFVPNQGYLGLETGSAGTLFSRPLFVTEKLPALGTTGDIVFIDPSMYVVGNRQDVMVEASEHVLFKANQTEFRVSIRCDGKPLLNNYVVLADGSSQASPFIVLGGT